MNDISFENMSNDDAVKALREIVQQPGPITLTVAKCWEPDPIVPQFEPRSKSHSRTSFWEAKVCVHVDAIVVLVA